MPAYGVIMSLMEQEEVTSLDCMYDICRVSLTELLTVHSVSIE